MSTQSEAIPEPFRAQRVAPAAGSVWRSFYWSLRRELWENRAIYLAPLAVAGLFLVGFLIHIVHLPAQVRGLPLLAPAQRRSAIMAPYELAAGLMMFTTILVGVFYCLDALHGERRDRSLLFWKSLPVSDLTTVLAKISIPLLILPVIASAVGALLHLVMLLVSSAVLAGNGLSPAVLWAQVPWFQMSLLLLYHILTAHALWPAPLYGWMLLVSGWARRATFIWASVPIVAIAGVEAIAFHTSHFITFVGYRLIGNAAVNAFTPQEFFPTNPMIHITPGTFLSSPSLWIGLAVTAGFVGLAVRLRRHQGAI